MKTIKFSLPLLIVTIFTPISGYSQFSPQMQQIRADQAEVSRRSQEQMQRNAEEQRARQAELTRQREAQNERTRQTQQGWIDTTNKLGSEIRRGVEEGRQEQIRRAEKNLQEAKEKAEQSRSALDVNAVTESTSVSGANEKTAFSSRQVCIVVGVSEGDTLNVRSAPAMNSFTNCKIPNGRRVQIRGDSVMNGKTEWIPISVGQEQGWVRSKYLQAEQ